MTQQKREREFRTSCELRFKTAADAPGGEEQEQDDLVDFEIDAYMGGILPGYGMGEVVDLAQLEHLASIPILVDHEHGRVAGWSVEIDNDQKRLVIRGKLLVGEGEEEGRRIRRRAKAGFPYQASMGWRVVEDELVPAGQARVINGRSLKGPFWHDRRCQLKEVSVVTLGRDQDTGVRVAADRGPSTGGTVDKTAEQLLAEERQRVKDITAAFPDDPAHANKHAALGSSLADAKADYADVLRKKLAEEKAARTAAESELAKSRTASATTTASPGLVPAIRPADGPPGSQPQADGRSAFARFRDLLSKAREAGLSREEAVRHVAREHPELHRAVLSEANPTKPEPDYLARARK